MRKYSSDPKINQCVLELIYKQNWSLSKRKKHHVLIAPNNRRIAIPSTPSDMNASYHFSRQVKALMNRDRS